MTCKEGWAWRGSALAQLSSFLLKSVQEGGNLAGLPVAWGGMKDIRCYERFLGRDTLTDIFAQFVHSFTHSSITDSSTRSFIHSFVHSLPRLVKMLCTLSRSATSQPSVTEELREMFCKCTRK